MRDDVSGYDNAEVQGEGVDPLRGERSLELRPLRRYFGGGTLGKWWCFVVSLEDREFLVSKESGRILVFECAHERPLNIAEVAQ